jgi:hypothetical protein
VFFDVAAWPFSALGLRVSALWSRELREFGEVDSNDATARR